jgi:K+-transporting ATPase ATPase A chain
MWFLPISITVLTIVLAIPLSKYLAWIMDGKYKAPKIFLWFEQRLDTGPQDWKQYTAALLVFNIVLFVFGYVILTLQPVMPLNPLGRGLLSPTAIFHTAVSFLTNTDVQHYSGDQHFSNFSQIFFVLPMWFLSASVGFCSLTAIIRAFRGEKTIGNYFVDMWRVVIYMFVPVSLLVGIIFIQQGMPMTYESAYQVSPLEPGAMGTDEKGQPNQQTIVVGPLAALVPIKMLGTNGGGFYGMNSAHPLENPSDLANFLTTFAMMLFPMSLVLMYGKMLRRVRHSWVIFSVMLVMFVGTIVWTIYFDTLKPNPGFAANTESRSFDVADPAAPGGATFAAVTVDVTCGAVNCEHDSLNPIAALSPMVGMWINSIYGGKGVGMINFLLFLVVGVFLAGQMVGRTPEYLGRKIGAREMSLAMLALLIHPIMILMPTGLFAATDWGMKAISNPGAHGFSQMLYQFSSASANNGSAFDGLGVAYGFYNNPNPAPMAIPWDIATGLVIIFSRYIPIIAPIAMAASLGAKKTAPFGPGTLRDDTFTFGCLMFGTIIILAGLLFLPVAALGPLAEHLGPIPFGG